MKPPTYMYLNGLWSCRQRDKACCNSSYYHLPPIYHHETLVVQSLQKGKSRFVVATKE